MFSILTELGMPARANQPRFAQNMSHQINPSAQMAGMQKPYGDFNPEQLAQMKAQLAQMMSQGGMKPQMNPMQGGQANMMPPQMTQALQAGAGSLGGKPTQAAQVMPEKLSSLLGAGASQGFGSPMPDFLGQATMALMGPKAGQNFGGGMPKGGRRSMGQMMGMLPRSQYLAPRRMPQQKPM